MKTRVPPVLITFALACFALVQNAQAVSPPPDGGYPGGNTAEGTDALLSLTTGTGNTAIGANTLNHNTEGSFNTATGIAALGSNRTGAANTANGDRALFSNTTGEGNTANGAFAMFSNLEGQFNTANGFQALESNATGSNNTANGDAALFNNKTGKDNTAIGANALNDNTGSQNVGLGTGAGSHLTTGSNNIVIGTDVVGEAGDSNTIRIGKGITRTLIDGINGATASGGAAVFVVGEGGRLGTLTSSARFKDDIKPMGRASEALFALKPVTFRYKKEIDSRSIPQFGLVAEEVEKVNPDLVIREADGRPQTVRYEQVNAMLLNEFLKEHRKVEDLKKDFQATVAQLTAQLKEQAAQIQKVSAQLEASKPAPQVVNNP